MSNELLTAALIYADRGYSVIPVTINRKGQKIPLIKWKEFQTRRATNEEITAWWSRWPRAMIGIITGELSGLLSIDCDSEEAYETVLKLLPEGIATTTVRTNRGWHLWFKYPKGSGITIGAGIMPEVDYRGEGGIAIVPPSVRPDGKVYSWEEGRTLGEVPPASLPEPLFNLLKNKNTNKGHDDKVRPGETEEDIFREGVRDENLFHVALSLAKTGNSEDYIRQVLTALVSSWGEHDERWINTKVASAFDRLGRKERNLSEEIREWILSSSGVFLSSEIAKCRQLSSREDQKNLSKILCRLVDEGLIERVGRRNGEFRRIETDLDAIDWMNCDDEPLSLAWPFGIEHLVNIYPRNIAVIAGAPNAGKTAFILNFIRLNMGSRNVHLFSSEGGPQEVKTRLQKFGLPLSEWKFQAWERSRDFADVIKPDAVNVIDYLELHDDFFKVGGILKGIQERLRAGFCLVALQKNAGRDEGLGGARGLEKPRLYLAMDGGSLKIVKGKSWARSDKNPNGLSIQFKLVDGCKFKTESEWIAA